MSFVRNSRHRQSAIRMFLWVAVTTILLSVHRFNTKATDALSTHSISTTKAIPYHGFKFAPNSVCISPQYFVAVRDAQHDGETDNGKHNATKIGNEPEYNYFTMRNVPGGGDCVFLAVALAAAASSGFGVSNKLLSTISRETRQVVAQVLSSPSGKLFIGPGRNNLVDARVLLRSAVTQEPDINTADEYLEALRKEGREGGLYGGGPEFVVLSNILRRPISVYEVDEERLKAQQETQKQQEQQFRNGDGGVGNSDDETSPEALFPIVCKGSFGDGVFEDPCLTSIPDSVILANMQPGAYSWRLHILILDSSPTEKHACVLFPQQMYK